MWPDIMMTLLFLKLLFSLLSKLCKFLLDDLPTNFWLELLTLGFDGLHLGEWLFIEYNSLAIYEFRAPILIKDKSGHSNKKDICYLMRFTHYLRLVLISQTKIYRSKRIMKKSFSSLGLILFLLVVFLASSQEASSDQQHMILNLNELMQM